MKHQRILLKLSGEALANKTNQSITKKALAHYAQEIKKVHNKNYQLAIVIGGGNIYRGKQGKAIGLNTIQSDQMGMLATMMNAIALSTTLTNIGIPTQLMSRLPMDHIAARYNPTKASELLTQRNIIIIGGGTGVPCFTTDSAGALTAIELNADLFIKGTQVDGVYNQDPHTNPQATYYNKISLQTALAKQLQILDTTAMILCLQHNLPIFVYNATQKNRLLNILTKGTGGTLLYHNNTQKT